MSTAEVFWLNGEELPWRRGLVIEQLVDERSASRRGIAVALDREVVPRSAWATTQVPPGACLEIVTAVAGG